jgi:outer membrane protein TolC
MSAQWLICLSLIWSGQAKGDPDQYPLALHRSMEIDDLDREIQRLHDAAMMKRATLASSQRLAQRGLLSKSDLEREIADAKYQEAREAEAKAYRALKVYERDTLGHAAVPDEVKAYSLLLDWLKTQEAIAQVDLDHRTFNLRQTNALYRRNAVSRTDLEDAELDYNTALANVALSRSRQSQVLMELSARKGEKPYDPAEYDKLKAEYLKARVHYFEVAVDGARRRLEIARDRSRPPGNRPRSIPPGPDPSK